MQMANLEHLPVYVLGKKQSPRHGFFPHYFPPMSGTLLFFRAPKLVSALDYPSATFQHQGSGNSLRGAKGSMYWSCSIQILSKCWGWSNLARPPLSRICKIGLPGEALYYSTIYPNSWSPSSLAWVQRTPSWPSAKSARRLNQSYSVQPRLPLAATIGPAGRSRVFFY